MRDLGFRKLNDEDIERLFQGSDTNQDGVVSWEEYLDLLVEHCLPAAPSASGAGGFAVEERITYAKIVNHILAGDEDCEDHIPLNTLDESLFYAFDDGIVLCKLVMAIDPGAIDARKITKKKPMNVFQAKINLDMALAAAKKLGIKVPGVDSTTFTNKTQKLILACLLAIIRKWL